MKYMAIAAVFVTTAAVVWTTRKHPKIVSLSVPPLLTFGLFVVLMVGCSPIEPADSTLNVPEETQPPAVVGEVISSSTPIPTVTLSDTPTPSVDISPSLTPEQSKNNDFEPKLVYPTPQVVKVPVEVIVELPGQTVEVIKEVYVDTPLDGMDMRKRQLEFIDELNAEYNSVFGMKIGGGEYCYNFTSKTEYLINYYFVSNDKGNIPCNVPLCLNADEFTIENIKNQIDKGD